MRRPPLVQYLTTKEVAEQLRVSQKTVERWIHKGLVSAIKTPGGRWRIPRDEVVKLWLETQE
jgi:excisionase family DNA binding protein